MAPYLKEAVGKLKPGQLSEVVSTEQGFQVFRLKGYRQGGMKPFEQVKDEIYRKLFNQDVDHEYEVWLKALRDKAYIKITY
jgi:peptidyl-prolyl cis-trans isomerase SurA